MKKLFVTFTLAFALIGQNLQGAEKYKTLVCNAATPTATYNVPAGELCHVLYVYKASGPAGDSLAATISGSTFLLTTLVSSYGYGTFSWGRGDSVGRSAPPIVITGPATITLTRVNSLDNFCTLRLIPTPNIGGVGQ